MIPLSQICENSGDSRTISGSGASASRVIVIRVPVVRVKSLGLQSLDESQIKDRSNKPQLFTTICPTSFSLCHSLTLNTKGASDMGREY